MKQKPKNNLLGTDNAYLAKRLKSETTVFSEWFLSILLSYLNMRDMVAMDSALCNKYHRAKWLECIVKDFGSVSTKIQPYLTTDLPIEWCSKKI